MSKSASIDEFLAETLRAVRTGNGAPWAAMAEVDWHQIWARIEYHGIAFLLNTQKQDLRDWPSALLDRMAEEARLIALWETTHHKAIVEVIKALDDQGIETVLMKGTALAYSLHEEPATRRRGDTDLLVRPRDQERTRTILQKLGWYRKEDPHGLYYQEGWLHDAAGFFVHSIDLHWEPSDRPVLQGILPISEFFADKQPLPQLHEAAYRPSLALMVLHAVINQKWHALHGYHSESGRLASKRRLIWSVDLNLMCKSMTDQDWRQLIEHSTANGVGALVAEALNGMQEDLGGCLPVAKLEELDAQPLDPSLKKYFDDPDSLAQFWIDLKMADSLSKKRRLVVTRAFPPREHLLQKYPAASRWPTALLQGRMLMETAGRALRKVGAR
ncbi:MAG: nucleotidyltransferase family protein [Pseudomonadota bacterium]